jgi:7,8-dihydropterin-6-yl-methyl-4-(beta-D-ribofuranosyl)aminobenzene 5'-phosphate synthase
MRNSGKMFVALTLAVVLQAVAILTAAGQPTPTGSHVRLRNLYDAFGKEVPGILHDFGFSTVIEHRGKTILFDAGTNVEVFKKNVRSLKIDLKKIDIVIVSHGHYDHIGGMDHVLEANPKVKIYLPKDFFSLGAPSNFPFREPDQASVKTLSKDEQYFRGEVAAEGRSSQPSGRFWRANFEYVTSAKEVLPGVTIVPTTSALMGTFVKYPPFDKDPQFIGMPELSLSLSTDKGKVIVSGCSHSSIETIIQAVQKAVAGEILLVTGGFHLIPYGREHIHELATRMRYTYGVKFVAPAHCSGHTAFVEFRRVFGKEYQFFGLGELITH